MFLDVDNSGAGGSGGNDSMCLSMLLGGNGLGAIVTEQSMVPDESVCQWFIDSGCAWFRLSRF